MTRVEVRRWTPGRVASCWPFPDADLLLLHGRFARGGHAERRQGSRTLGRVKGLLLRLSALDADAATALRVIAHFEALLAGRFDAAALVRSTAGLAECTAGLEPAEGRTVRFGPEGRAPAQDLAPALVSGSAALTPAGRVWLERPGGRPGTFDELVLEWMAICAQVLAGHVSQQSPPQVADPMLVELALSEREALEDRARALRLLGLAPERPLRVVAVAGSSALEAGAESVALLRDAGLSTSATVRVLALGPHGVALVQRRDGAASPAGELREVLAERATAGGSRASRLSRGLRLGVGGSVQGLDVGTSWRQACTALRFAQAGDPWEAVVDHDALGSVVLLAEIPPERLPEQPEVQALQELAAGEGGTSTMAALTAFCRTGSLRQAAQQLHLHHSSVAARLAHIEAALGWRLSDPVDRFQAQLSLYAVRLWRTHQADG